MAIVRCGVVLSLALGISACAHVQPTSTPGAATACPDLPLPVVDPSLVPAGPPLRAVAHAAATGTQDYVCASGGGSFAWTFQGPEATLVDCNGAVLGRHLASEAGAAAPKWEARDGSFVVARKVNAVPSSEAGAVPWLLLQVTTSGGAGMLNGVTYVQRTATKGGAMPSDGCDAAHAGAVVKVPYSADYWFLGR